MNYLSVCSGIEAATVAWHKLGWNPVGFSEIEPFPSEVLKHHYPEVTNFGDMTKYKEWELGTDRLDLLVGGTPCQSFSVAGLRKGLDDPRGNLMLTYCGILDHFRPRWFVWENVPGVLSSNGGRDFGSFLGALAELGYGFSYRVLDAQYFGVAQRRRRVFVVGHLGNWQRAAAVLFERQSLCRDTAPRRETGKEIANCLGASPSSASCPNVGSGQGTVVPVSVDILNHSVGNVAHTLSARNDMQTGAVLMATLNASDATKWGSNQWVDEGKAIIQPSYGIPGNWIGRKPKNGGNAVEPMPINTMVALRHNALGEGTGFGIGDPGDPAYTLTKGHSHAVAFGVGEQPDLGHCLRSGASKADKHESTTYVAQPIGTDCYNGSITGDVACTMGTPGSSVNASGPTVMQNMAVRRLTPIECERLQGFSDNYTNIPWRKSNESPDGPRYKALGNSMAVPVMRWIGEQIYKVNETN